jgi:hypothetical protein
MNLVLSKFLKSRNLLIAIFLGYCVGTLILDPNRYSLLFIILIPLGLLLLKEHEIGFYIIIFSIFFADWLAVLGWITPEMTLLPEIILLVLTLKVILLRIEDKQFIRTPIDWLVLLLLFWGLLSTFINSQPLLNTIIGFRFDFKYVLMFFLIVNLNPDQQFFKRIIRLLIVLLLIQVPVALIKLQYYGQGESAIGTYAVHGGALSTLLPLIGMSIFMGLFFYEKSRWYYIFFILLFILFAIVGGKRAFVFFAFLLFLYLFWQTGRKNFGKFTLVAPFIIAGFLAAIFFIPSLRPTFDNPRYLVDFSVSYSTARHPQTGSALGRSSALKSTWDVSIKNPKNFLVGNGPGSLSESYLVNGGDSEYNKLGIDYGHSQLVVMCLEYGWIGTLLFFILFIPLFFTNQKLFRLTNDNYWRAISFGYKGLLFTYLMGSFYTKIFHLDITAFIFWFLSAVVYCMETQTRNLSLENLS